MSDQLTTESSPSLLLKKEISHNIFLPNFQRQFIWDDKTQKELLKSLLAGVPIGQFMFFKASTDSFKRRALCHSLEPNVKNDRDTYFLLDGQQRLSTLKNIVCDIFSSSEVRRFPKIGSVDQIKKAVDPKLKNRWFISLPDLNFFGLKKLEFELPNDSLPEDFDHYIKHDALDKWVFSETSELITECRKQDLIPLWTLMQSGDEKNKENKKTKNNPTWKALKAIAEDRCQDILSTNPRFPQHKIETWTDDFYRFLQEKLLKAEVLLNYKIDSNNPNKMIAAFEQANKEGMTLTAYDLVVAKYAHSNHEKSLTDLLDELLSKKRAFKSNLCKGLDGVNSWTPKKVKGFWKGKQPDKPFRDIFLNCLALELFDKTKTHVWKNLKVAETKAEKILTRAYQAADIDKCAQDTAENLLVAFEFMVARLGITSLTEIKYERMFLPIYTTLRGYTSHESPILNSLEYWYWLSIFGGRYQSNQSERSTEDIKTLSDWIGKKKIKNTKNPFKKYAADVFAAKHYSTFGAISMTGKSKKGKQFIDDQAPNSVLAPVVLQFILSCKPIDFSRSGDESISAKKVLTKETKRNAHHLLFCGHDRSKTSHPINSALNKTYLSEKENSRISNDIENYKELLETWEKNNCHANLEGHSIENNFINRASNFISKKRLKEIEDADSILVKFLYERFTKLRAKVQNHLNTLP